MSAVVLPGDDPGAIGRAAQTLLAGGLVGMPTETVYGLAANAIDAQAVAKVFKAKERPSFDPLIVHVGAVERASELAEFNEIAHRLAALWPGPMTLVLPRKKSMEGAPIVPDLVTSGLDSVGLRIPDHTVAQALLAQSGLALAAPSANRFGSISPTRAKDVVEELGERLDLVLDGGPCQRGIESTVVRVHKASVEVLRLGAMPVERIEQAASVPVELRPPSSSPGQSAMPSPGMVERHYAPGTPMNLIATPSDFKSIDASERVGLIGMGDLIPGDLFGYAAVINLSEAADMAEAASRLFASLRELDAMGLARIDAVMVPDEGLGRAINDRLKRGSAR